MTLSELVQQHGLIIIALAWAAYVALVIVQSRREEATHTAATSEPVTFEEVVTERPRMTQLEASAILDARKEARRA